MKNYRVWDIIENRYITEKVILEPNGKILVYNGCDYNSLDLGILEQGVGLKDKHGNHIFEGDIIDTGSNYTGVIVYSPPSFQINLGSGYLDNIAKDSHRFYTVIGNIHEGVKE